MIDAPKISAEAAKQQLPKRFYDQVGLREGEQGYGIVLDGRSVKTPKRRALEVPTEVLADAIALEWQAQADVIDPTSMPLTKIANTAIDGVMGQERVIHEDIVKYIGNDLVCYRADAPQELIAIQKKQWDPLLEWVVEQFGARLKTTNGVMPIEQNVIEIAKVASGISSETAFSLAPLHVITTLTGSGVLAVAYLKGRLNTDEVWTAAHVDEDYQIAQWGEDHEAAERRATRFAELKAAARFIELLR